MLWLICPLYGPLGIIIIMLPLLLPGVWPRVGQLEREASLREAALSTAQQEVAGLKEDLRAQAATLQQQLLELTAYERQV